MGWDSYCAGNGDGTDYAISGNECLSYQRHCQGCADGDHTQGYYSLCNNRGLLCNSPRSFPPDSTVPARTIPLKHQRVITEREGGIGSEVIGGFRSVAAMRSLKLQCMCHGIGTILDPSRDGL